MRPKRLLDLFEKGKRRWRLVGNERSGVVAGLDLEGRLFVVLDGDVLNRVNPEAILRQSTRNEYLNPGGDVLWPAPEGTAFGYEYTTGKWRVPPAIRGTQYWVVEKKKNYALIGAEIDLVNNRSSGIPTVFERGIQVYPGKNHVTVRVEERIRYIGRRTLRKGEWLLAPWTLCQFDCGPGCEVVFPKVKASEIWDFYDPSGALRYLKDGFCHTRTDGSQRYQIGLGKSVPWIEFRSPRKNLRVFRKASPIFSSQRYIDIADAPPSVLPSMKGVRYSVYSDTKNFMEIEAVGGCPLKLEPGCLLKVLVETRYISGIVNLTEQG